MTTRFDGQILERAISDAGYWRWWVNAPPDKFQLEFSGTQLWWPPTSRSAPPAGVVAVQLIRPKTVLLLAQMDQPDDWHQRMQRDELPPSHLVPEAFTLSSQDVADKVLDARRKVHVAVGRASNRSVPPGHTVVAFLAGPFGFYGVAAEVRVLNRLGELSPGQVAAAHAEWWRYYKEYWRRRETTNPMPRDPTCDVTIPIVAD